MSQKNASDAISKENRDPWVYEFSSDAVKDIKYPGGRAASGSLAQMQDVANNKYMANSIHDFTRNYTTPFANFPRSDDAPTTAEVANWPVTWSTAQVSSKGLPLKAYAESFPRSDSAPTSAEVKNWPYPQFSQKFDEQNTNDIKATEHVNKTVYDFVNENVPSTNENSRRREAPKSADVANWPYPQFSQKSDEQNS